MNAIVVLSTLLKNLYALFHFKVLKLTPTSWVYIIDHGEENMICPW
jgi:hypothetical protein